MGSSETSQKKVSTHDLFGDILGEVESAWEKRKQGGGAQLEGRSTSERNDDGANRRASAAPAEASSELETARLEPSSNDRAVPDRATTEPEIAPFEAPHPSRDLPQNGHRQQSVASGTGATAPETAEPELPTAADVPSASEQPTDELSTAERPTAERPTAAGPPTAKVESPPELPSAESSDRPASKTKAPESTAVLPIQESQPANGPAAAAIVGSEAPVDEDSTLSSGPHLPWMEERSSTNWGRLAGMAAVVGLVALGVWWFALRPTGAALESEPPRVVTEPSQSFIAEVEEQAVADAAAEEIVAASDEVTALVEPAAETPTESQVDQVSADQPVGTQPADAAAAVSPAPRQQTGPTAEQLEAMIAGQMAAQEQRLRATFEEQRRALEEQIARLEAANDAANDAPPANEPQVEVAAEGVVSGAADVVADETPVESNPDASAAADTGTEDTGAEGDAE